MSELELLRSQLEYLQGQVTGLQAAVRGLIAAHPEPTAAVELVRRVLLDTNERGADSPTATPAQLAGLQMTCGLVAPQRRGLRLVSDQGGSASHRSS